VLTLDKLKAMAAKTVFNRGEAVDGPLGINLTGKGGMLKWVAVRGVYHDWNIYAGRNTTSYEGIARCGETVHDKNTIKKLVSCDEEAFRLYRH